MPADLIETALIIDTECSIENINKIDQSKDAMIEFAGILYSVSSGVLASVSTLIPHDRNDGESIHRISNSLLRRAAADSFYPVRRAAMSMFMRMYALADVVVAHNVEFDKQWFPSELHTKPWLCTCYDFKFPKSEVGVGIVAACLAHGLGVANAHRAMGDAALIAALFDRVAETTELQELFAYAMRPKATYISLAGFNEKDLVKAHGFKWHDASHPKFHKLWVRTMAIEDAEKLPFKVQRYEEPKEEESNASLL